MRSVEGQREMAPKGALVRHLKDRFPPWHNSAELLRRCENNILSPNSMTSVIPHSPLALAHPNL